MALFSYRCLREHVFDSLQPIGKTPDSLPCPECGHSAKKILTAPSVHFSGDGFTRTSFGAKTK